MTGLNQADAIDAIRPRVVPQGVFVARQKFFWARIKGLHSRCDAERLIRESVPLAEHGWQGLRVMQSGRTNYLNGTLYSVERLK